VNKGRAGDVEGALLGEQAEIERLDAAGRLAEQRDEAERRQAIERFEERVLADGVVNHRHHLSAGDLLHTGDEVLLRVVDDMGAAVLARQRSLPLAAHGADHGRAEVLRPLAEDEADATSRGAQQDGIAGLHPVGLADQVLHRQTFEHHRRGGGVVDGVGQLEQAVGRDQAGLRIGAKRRAAVGDTVTGGEIGDAGADLLDDDGGRRHLRAGLCAADRG